MACKENEGGLLCDSVVVFGCSKLYHDEAVAMNGMFCVWETVAKRMR